MAEGKRPTHRDVARLAGVSTAVVSYVVNDGPRRTSPEVRSRVLRAIEELNYHPSDVARGLRAQSTRTVAFVISDYFPLDVFVSPYSAGVLTGLTAELRTMGYYLLIYPLAVGEDLAGLRKMLGSGRVDGVVARLVEDPPATDPILEVLSASGVPSVLIERTNSERFDLSSVTYDDEQGAREATQYLTSRGHRRIAHIRGDLRYSTAQSRLSGYRQGLLAGGLALDDALVAGDTWAPSDAVAATRQLLGLAEPPTAVFAASDSLALSTVQTIRELGRRVPDDVAVVGFDDIPSAQEAVPPLTTMRIPLGDIGKRAADLVLELARGGGTQRITVPLELVRRGSA